MITMFQQRLKTNIPTTPAPAAAAVTSGPPARPVTATSTGVGEILALHVGCWQPPIHVGIERYMSGSSYSLPIRSPSATVRRLTAPLPVVPTVRVRRVEAEAAEKRSTEDRVGDETAAKSAAAPS